MEPQPGGKKTKVSDERNRSFEPADAMFENKGASNMEGSGYWESLFSGNMCCKLWFTVPRSTSRRLVARLTDLLRTAAVDQREDVNAHIPHDVFRGIAGHTRDKVCIANHKSFWPHTPTLLHLFGDLKVLGGAQCMGDMVVQNSSQLHWGVNLAAGVKAESSNCAGSDFMSLCPDCSDGLYCGAEGPTLKKIFHQARKEYWARKRVRGWRKKSICWGYHGCGCIRPRALGLDEDPGRDNNTRAAPANRRLRVAPSCSSGVKEAGGDGLGWGRAFDWVQVFKEHKVNMCFDKWNLLEWLPRNDSCRPSSLFSLLEDEAFASACGPNEASCKYTSGESKKPWELDPDATCIRIVRGASPERLKRSDVCTAVDPPAYEPCGKRLQKEGTDQADHGRSEEKGSDVSSQSPPTAAAGPGAEADYVATAEFQRMWPVFLRVSREDRSPLRRSDGGEGEVVFLGCVLEVFHMRLRTEDEIVACLDAVAGVARVDVSVEKADTHNGEPIDKLERALDKSPPPKRVCAQDENGRMKVHCVAAEVAPHHGEEAIPEQSMSGLKYFPRILFEPAPPTCASEVPRDSAVSPSITAKTIRGSNEVDYTEKVDVAKEANGLTNLAVPPASSTAAVSPSGAAFPAVCCGISDYSCSETDGGMCNKGEATTAQSRRGTLVSEWVSRTLPGSHRTNGIQRSGAPACLDVSQPVDSEREPGELSDAEDNSLRDCDQRTAPFSGSLGFSVSDTQESRGHQKQGATASPCSRLLPQDVPRALPALANLYPLEKTKPSEHPPEASYLRSYQHSYLHLQSPHLARKAVRPPYTGVGELPLKSRERSSLPGNGLFLAPERPGRAKWPDRGATGELHFGYLSLPGGDQAGLQESNIGVMNSVVSMRQETHSSVRGTEACLKSTEEGRLPCHSEVFDSSLRGVGCGTLYSPGDTSYCGGARECVTINLPRGSGLPGEHSVRDLCGSRRSTRVHLCSMEVSPSVTSTTFSSKPNTEDVQVPEATTRQSSAEPSGTYGFNKETAVSPKDGIGPAGEAATEDKRLLQAKYSAYLKQRLQAVIDGVWSWRSDAVLDFSASYHDKFFSSSAAQEAIRNGFTPYILMHYASTTRSERALQPLDMSVSGRRNIPFHGFSEELVDSFRSGIGHGMMYYSAVPGSVFPIHCEQGGLGAFNMVVGALASYTKQLHPSV